MTKSIVQEDKNNTPLVVISIVLICFTAFGIILIQPYKETELKGNIDLHYEVTLKNHTIPISDILRLINPDITNVTIEYNFGEITIKSDTQIEFTGKNIDYLLAKLPK